MAQTKLRQEQLSDPSELCYCHVRKSTAQTISGGPTKVTWDTEDYDVGSNFDSTTNNRFVAPTAGLYIVTSQLLWNNPGTEGQVAIFIFVNNSSVGHNYIRGINAVDDPVVAITRVVPLNATDYVEIFAQEAATGDIDITASSARTWFEVTRLADLT